MSSGQEPHFGARALALFRAHARASRVATLRHLKFESCVAIILRAVLGFRQKVTKL
jgi:hypothetical protein